MRISSPIARARFAQRGTAAVEFSLVALVFFTLVFGILELARIVYMYNTLADVTRTAARSAANISWTDTTALNRAKQRAIFRESEGGLMFGMPVNDRHIRIEYLYLKQPAGPITMNLVPPGLMPSSPGNNRLNCLTAPYGDSASAGGACIRLVRVQICKPNGSGCEGVPYKSLFPLLPFNIALPTSTTVVSAESLGYRPGDSVSP